MPLLKEIDQVLLSNPFYIKTNSLEDWYDRRHGEYITNSVLYLIDRANLDVSIENKAIITIVACHLHLQREDADTAIRASKLVPLFDVPLYDIINTLDYIHGHGTRPSSELGMLADILLDVYVFLPYFLSTSDEIRRLLRYSDRHRYASIKNNSDFLEAFKQDYMRSVPVTEVMKEFLSTRMELVHSHLDLDLADEERYG